MGLPPLRTTGLRSGPSRLKHVEWTSTDPLIGSS